MKTLQIVVDTPPLDLQVAIKAMSARLKAEASRYDEMLRGTWTRTKMTHGTADGSRPKRVDELSRDLSKSSKQKTGGSNARDGPFLNGRWTIRGKIGAIKLKATCGKNKRRNISGNHAQSANLNIYATKSRN